MSNDPIRKTHHAHQLPCPNRLYLSERKRFFGESVPCGGQINVQFATMGDPSPDDERESLTIMQCPQCRRNVTVRLALKNQQWNVAIVGGSPE